jgi:hypothetical protein
VVSSFTVSSYAVLENSSPLPVGTMPTTRPEWPFPFTDEISCFWSLTVVERTRPVESPLMKVLKDGEETARAVMGF